MVITKETGGGNKPRNNFATDNNFNDSNSLSSETLRRRMELFQQNRFDRGQPSTDSHPKNNMSSYVHNSGNSKNNNNFYSTNRYEASENNIDSLHSDNYIPRDLSNKRFQDNTRKPLPSLQTNSGLGSDRYQNTTTQKVSPFNSSLKREDTYRSVPLSRPSTLSRPLTMQRLPKSPKQKFNLSIVLNLQPTLHEEHIFEVLTKRQNVGPHTMVLDYSFELEYPKTIDGIFLNKRSQEVWAGSFFPLKHGVDSVDKTDNVKAIYVKKTLQPMAYLSSPVHSITLNSKDVNGRYTLEFKVIRDIDYECTELYTLNSKDSGQAEFYPEGSGYVGNIKLLENLVSKTQTVFESITTVGQQNSKYKIDYDIITVVLYGCKAEIDFTKLYKANELLGTRSLRSIAELPSGAYIARNDGYNVYDFDQNAQTMKRDGLNDLEIYQYDASSDSFINSSGDELGFNLENVLVEEKKDADGNITSSLIYQFDFRADGESETHGMYVNNQRSAPGLDELEPMSRGNILEFTRQLNQYSKIESINPNLTNLLSGLDASLNSNYEFLKLKITFEEGTCIDRDFDGSIPVRSDYLGTDGKYYYPYKPKGSREIYSSNRELLRNLESIEIGSKPFAILYTDKISDSTTQLRDFEEMLKVFRYIGSNINYSRYITVSGSYDLAFSQLSTPIYLLQERRTHPILFEYLKNVHTKFLEDRQQITELQYNSIPETNLKHYKYVAGVLKKRISFSFTRESFMRANYYGLTDQERSAKEAGAMNVNAYEENPMGFPPLYPQIIVSMEDIKDVFKI